MRQPTTLIIAAIALILVGCGASTPTAAPTSDPDSTAESTQETLPAMPPLTCDAKPETEVRFLALGDSYTIGESVAEAERWPMQLADLLRESGVQIAAPEIIARTGWTTNELAAAITEANPQGPYQIVSLLIGVNNQYRGYPQDTYRDEFAALLDQSITFAGGDANRVIVLSIPDWGVTPFGKDSGRQGISDEIDAFNAIAKEISDARGVHYVDVTPISRGAAVDFSLVAGDTLHPSGKMYTQWARLAFDEACAALKSTTP
jgi:lysophospholipase L1-like esterase